METELVVARYAQGSFTIRFARVCSRTKSPSRGRQLNEVNQIVSSLDKNPVRVGGSAASRWPSDPSGYGIPESAIELDFCLPAPMRCEQPAKTETTTSLASSSQRNAASRFKHHQLPGMLLLGVQTLTTTKRYSPASGKRREIAFSRR